MNPLDLGAINLSGRTLIEASAGTGKTWTIAALYVLLLLEKELHPGQILVVTYTKAATAELRERIRGRIASTLDLFSGTRPPLNDSFEKLLADTRHFESQRARQLLTRALYSFDDAAIFTIHGFCQRALLENAFESGSLFGCDMISDQSTIVKQICDDFWRAHILTESDDFVDYLAAGSYTPEKLARPLEGHFQNPDLKIIPLVVSQPHEQLIAERNQLYDLVCSLWLGDRSAALQQLKQARLHQQSYKTSQIDGAAGEFDRWVAHGKAAAPNSKLEFFSIRKIETKTTAATVTKPDHPLFSLCGRMFEVNQSIDRVFSARIVAIRIELKKWLEEQLPLRKKRMNQRSFDDLLLDLDRALESDSGSILVNALRQRYQAAMIDEFQDTDSLQWNIFEHLGRDPDYPLFLIGDPKQSIYSFRGADVFAYLKAGRSVRNENRHTLNYNFRSYSLLVKAVSTIFSACNNPFLIEDMLFQPVESGRSADDCLHIKDIRDRLPLKVWVYRRDNDKRPATKAEAITGIAKAVASEIALLLSNNYASITVSGRCVSLDARDIAVLVKTHKQADRVQKALSECGVSSVQMGSSTIFETPEALDLAIILRAVAAPHNEKNVREALVTKCMGISAQLVSTFFENPGDHQEWEKWLLHFNILHSAAASGGIIAVMSRLLGSCGVREHLLACCGGQRSLTNLLQCCELLHNVEQGQGKDLTSLITWLERKIRRPSRDDDTLLRLETDENAVTISTIHASKGLQYPVVFLPFLWDAPSMHSGRTIFHDSDGRLVLDLSDEEPNVLLADSEVKAEAARLLYVALTRAEFRCYVAWGAINGASESPLLRFFHNNDSSVLARLNDQAIANGIKALLISPDSGIEVSLMPVNEHSIHHTATVPEGNGYTCRTPVRSINDDWRVASFSSITHGSAHTSEPRDLDSSQIDTARHSTELPAAVNGPGICDFPRGAKAGVCLHEIFEHLYYSNLSEQSITAAARSALSANGFQDSWLPVLKRMVTEVTSAPILAEDPDFSLSLLLPGSWHTEMEFYLPVKNLSPDIITELFGGIMDKQRFGDFIDVLGRLKFRQSLGMLQGFIDLVFTHKDRYYIIDWKSNHLGMNMSDYNQQALHESMSHNAYTLQYHLYTLALDRLLQSRLPGYSYETHFGGVIYLYIRGISNGEPLYGIYRERPLPEFVHCANELILA